MRADLVEDALRMAITLRGELSEQVVFHTDRGTQGGFNRSSTPRRSIGPWWPGSGCVPRWAERVCAGIVTRSAHQAWSRFDPCWD